MAYHTPGHNNSQFLKNLRAINEKAKVEPDIIDLIEAFARLKLDTNKPFEFYPDTIRQNPSDFNEFLKKNKHLDPQVLQFLKFYFETVEKRGLKCLLNKDHLSHMLGITANRLEWLASPNVTHYKYFNIRKSNGSERKIFAPKMYLKGIQRKILDHILIKVQLHSHAEGFRKKRSILTNAKRHIGKKIVIKMDLKDFFPSITFPRVLGFFRSLGYPENVSMILTKLVVHQGKLPTGAPTSPVISNILATKLDKRFCELGKKKGFDYSRYADDLTVSSNDTTIKMMIPFFKRIIQEEGFEINKAKLRILRNSNRQKITGIVVNQKANIEKNDIKKIRAVIYNLRHKDVDKQIKKWAQLEGGADKKRAYSMDQFKSSLLGKINYIRMVNPKAGQKLLNQWRAFEKTV
ncbi:MAG: reverse transcriptase family protein [Desulfobacterales bacterium]|nr:reverse transcriptase family protein [Desulfobacterales bacterium]